MGREKSESSSGWWGPVTFYGGSHLNKKQQFSFQRISIWLSYFSCVHFLITLDQFVTGSNGKSISYYPLAPSPPDCVYTRKLKVSESTLIKNSGFNELQVYLFLIVSQETKQKGQDEMRKLLWWCLHRLCSWHCAITNMKPFKSNPTIQHTHSSYSLHEQRDEEE